MIIKIKNIILTGLITLSTVSFTACSDGEVYFQNTSIIIDTDCVVDPDFDDISTYITIYSGDVIVKEDMNSSISTYHDITGHKSVCRISGKSYIIRK